MIDFSLNYTTVWERFLEWYSGSWVDRAFSFLGERVFVVAFGEYEKIPLPPNAGTVARNWILSFLVAFWIAAVTMAVVKAVPGGFIRRMLALGAIDADHAVTLAEVGYGRSAAVKRDLAHGGALAKLLCRVGDSEKTVAGTRIPSSEDPADENAGERRLSLWERLKGGKKIAPPAPEATETPESSAVETSESSATAAPVDQISAAADSTMADSTMADSTMAGSTMAGSSLINEKKPANQPPTAPLDFSSDRFYIPEELRVRAELRFAKRGSGILSAILSIVISTLAAFLVCNLLPLLFHLGNKILGG
ncbi:MAG: hypothetical protein E7680_05295 [Ruminococcaceae bacterium]|nr:hypothetical protein [Oscillospiraceae bacterium]